MRASSNIPKLFDSNKKEIGVRITDNLITQAIVESLGNPIASASLHDDDAPILEYFTDPYHIFENYENKVGVIIDGGRGKIEPSTVIDCFSHKEARIVRQGAGKINL